jgi:hypothetical protein
MAQFFEAFIPSPILVVGRKTHGKEKNVFLPVVLKI